MPETHAELKRLLHSPYATDYHRAWVRHVLGASSSAERLAEMSRYHAEDNFLHNYFGGTPTPEAFNRRIHELDAALSQPLPEPVRALRGLHDISFLTAADGHPLGIRDPRALIGTTQTERGYMSTSLGENPAVVDNNPFEYKMKLDLPPGTHGVWMGRKSAYEDQRELLLPRDTQYRITGVTHTGLDSGGASRWQDRESARLRDPREGGPAFCAIPGGLTAPRHTGVTHSGPAEQSGRCRPGSCFASARHTRGADDRAERRCAASWT
jgi:hypothetical protein